MSGQASNRAEIFEVGPRDGLQNEARIIPTDEKIALIACLAKAGYRRIEVASFVSPKWVPQMADGGEVLAGLTRRKGLSLAALVPNMKGFARAVDAGVDEIAIFSSASEGFSRANLNMSVAESLEAFEPVVQAAKEAGLPVRGYISVVVECPFDGPTAPDTVARLVEHLLPRCYEISLGDTIGRGAPAAVDAMLQKVCSVAPADRLAGHFHDTSGSALDNIDVALGHGLRVFDASVGGLGGCPYAPGAAGNVASEAVDRHLKAQGFDTGLDAAVLRDAARLAKGMRPDV